MQLAILLIGVIGAYLLGSLSSAVLVCYLFRLPDPRTHGSNNPGATNVLRIGGRFPAVLTLAGDVAKGWLPLFICKQFTSEPWILSAVLVAAIFGHLFPIFFQFKGGKGIATYIGGLLGVSLSLGGIFIFCWLGIFTVFRYSSLAGLLSTASIPFWAWGFLDHRYMPGLALLSLIIIWRHRENVRRLLNGTETRSSFKKKLGGS